MRRSTRWAVPVLVLCALAAAAGCTSGRDPTASATGTTDEPIALSGHVAKAALEHRRRADLDVVSGANTVRVHMADLGLLLYRATTPSGSDVEPAGVVSDNVVTLSLESHGHRGPAVLDVTLNATVDWRVRLDGGATEETVDATGGRLRELDLGAGASRIDVTLPRPDGTVPVEMTGGAGTFAVHLPDGVPARVTFAGGAGTATIDGAVHTGIAGSTVLDALDWSAGTDRYAVTNTAGVGAFSLGRSR
ncbi:MAG: hypothetical protein WCA46_05175 [Actinocatenispora sp.]